jgi:hypothetical protein
VVKHVDAAKLRVVAAEVLAVAADAVLVAHLLPKSWRPSGYRSGPPAFTTVRAKKQPGDGEHAGAKRREERRNARVSRTGK